MQRLFTRTAVLLCFARVAADLGLDAQALAAEVGIGSEQFATPDLPVRAGRVHRLLELAAARTEVVDIGLRVARERLNFSHLGALGVLARDEPDLRSVLQRVARDMHLHSTSNSLHLTEAGDTAILEMRVDADGEPVIRQSTECAMGGLCFILRHLLGAEWRPAALHLIHARWRTDLPHRAAFGCPVVFGSEANLLVMHRADLDRPNPMHQAGLGAYTSVKATSLALSGAGKITPELVAHIIQRLIPAGTCSAPQVARELGIDRRTLHRHLAQADASFTGLLQETRQAMAIEYLSADVMSVTEISDLLGFGSVSNFSRWFATTLGSAPTRWRDAQRSQPPQGRSDRA
jgi:AraC-like DNA-binding protein